MAKKILEVPTYEPKLDNRFIVTIIEGGPKIDAHVIFECSRPKYKKLSDGTVEWGNMILKMFDPIAKSTTHELMKFIEKSKRRVLLHSPLFSFNLDLLDPTGEVIETWVIEVEDIVEVDFDTVSWYDKSDALKIKMVVKPSLCSLVF